MAPGMAGMAPGMPGMAPGMAGMAPGVPGMAPGVPGMAPGMPGMAPGVPGMAPGMSGMAPAPEQQRIVRFSKRIFHTYTIHVLLQAATNDIMSMFNASSSGHLMGIGHQQQQV